jgi:hypothetical protein
MLWTLQCFDNAILLRTLKSLANATTCTDADALIVNVTWNWNDDRDILVAGMSPLPCRYSEIITGL